MPVLTAFFDGACEPVNPGGTASYGAVIFRGKDRIWECSELYIPKIDGATSNNIAEYCGFGVTLKYLKDNNLDDLDTTIQGDSKLVIEQMLGNWKIRDGLYVPFARRAEALLLTFRRAPLLQWIPRKKNSIADELSKACLLKANVKITDWNSGKQKP